MPQWHFHQGKTREEVEAYLLQTVTDRNRSENTRPSHLLVVNMHVLSLSRIQGPGCVRRSERNERGRPARGSQTCLDWFRSQIARNRSVAKARIAPCTRCIADIRFRAFLKRSFPAEIASLLCSAAV